jgi:vancomycin aglycone glucosyltransferase
MRALLSAVGTRGDVQPVIALAIEVRKLGHDVHLCVPPNFVEWTKALGFPVTSVGVEMRAPRFGAPASQPPTIPDLIADQFATIGAAADGQDIILGANAHQYAAPSIAELRGIPYVNAVYAPTALPNDANTRSWNERALERVNANRAQLGLTPIDDVLPQIITEHPWLAFDATLAPQPSASKVTVTQTGAWLLEDRTPLPSDLEEFLAAGEPPVHFGFGSMPVSTGTSRTLIEAARLAGRRAIVSRGWAELELIDRSPDCIAIGDVNQQALFRRVAAVVHHGGAGTTHAAALAGAPQAIVPMFSDQPFWASRVCELGIGTSVPFGELTANRLSSVLQMVSDPQIAERAKAIASRIATDGAAVAARHLVDSANS